MRRVSGVANVPTPSDEPQPVAVYRRVHPSQLDARTGKPKPQVFALRERENSLSVFDASCTTPREVLQAFIHDTTTRLNSDDETERAKAQRTLRKFPTVEVMVEQNWRVIQIPAAEIQTRGFEFTATEANGHLEFRGERQRFLECELEFMELVETGVAPLLDANACLGNAEEHDPLIATYRPRPARHGKIV